MSNKRKITWELPFKNMHYLNSLTNDLAKIPQIILLTAIQDAEGVVEKVNITLRNTGENRDSLILHIGAILGVHSVGYAEKMEEMEEAKADFMGAIGDLLSAMKERKEEVAENEISKAQEQETDGAPKGEDFVPNKDLELTGDEVLFKEIEDDLPPSEEKGTVTVDDKEEIETKEDVKSTEEIIQEEEKVEEVIKDIVQIKEKASIKPKSKKKDNTFIAKLRVILNNFKK